MSFFACGCTVRCAYQVAASLPCGAHVVGDFGKLFELVEKGGATEGRMALQQFGTTNLGGDSMRNP